MAAYFQLISKVTGEATSFTRIDEDMCAHFGVDCDPDKYLIDWYNCVGWRVAMGKSLDDVIAEFIAGIGEETKNGNENNAIGYSNLVRVTKWLKEHYTTDSWYQVGK